MKKYREILNNNRVCVRAVWQGEERASRGREQQYWGKMKKNVKNLSVEEAMKKGASPSSSSSNSSSGGQGHHRLNMSSKAKSDDPGKIFKLIDDNIIGKSAVFLGPFGRRKGKQ